MTFAEAIRQARLSAGLSQSKLARKAGFDHSYVSRMEAGQRTPTREAVGNLARALNYQYGSPTYDVLLIAAGFAPSNNNTITDPVLIRLNDSLKLAPNALTGPVRITLTLLAESLENARYSKPPV